MKLFQIAALAVVVLLATAAQTQQKDAGTIPDLEGGWLRLDTGGGGSYHGIDLMFPKAELTPQYAKLLPPDMDEGLSGNGAATAPHQAGQPYVVYQPGARGGGGGGFGVGVDINSAPFFLVQTKNEILITREGSGPGRHIFVDGRSHPDPSEFVLNSAGHSLGHYENGKLVVDTTDFAPGMTSFGRGYKGPHTHLTETFDLSADGQRLTIHYKWDDPEIYEKPLIYDISFERLPKGSYVTEDWNDAADPLSYQSIVPPEQK
ncbi:MAG TPA: hypothetical protein VJS43_02495 [Candidatus Acidoferrales bacterium]|nr:hypothetical protein [Candidatus Acidoferrales bacterium]